MGTSETGAIGLDAFAPLALPAGDRPWVVERGRVEAYFLSPQRRRLIAIVGAGGQIFPLAEEAMREHGFAIVLIASTSARIKEDRTPELASAHHWLALHGDIALPEDDGDRMAAIQAMTAGLETRFAALDSEQAQGLLSRVAARSDGERDHGGMAAELAWLASENGWPPPAEVRSGTDIANAVRRAGFRSRRITLDPDWTLRQGNPMLVVDNGEPVAAVWRRDGWRLRGQEAPIRDPAGISRTAWTIHPPFDPLPSGFVAMARFLLPDLRAAIPLFIATGLVLAAVGLVLPFATAALFDDAVPSGDLGQLISLAVALAGASAITALFSALQNRIRALVDGTSSARLAAALADHVLALPETALRGLTSGDTNQRMDNIEQVRQLMVNLLLSGALTALTAIAYFLLLFTYDVRLALVGLLLALVSVALVAAGRALQAEPLRQAAELDGRIAGRTYELLEGVVKLRTGAAENRALARWRDLYVREQAVGAQGAVVGGAVAQIGEAYATVTLIALYAAIVGLGTSLAPGLVLAFLAAFGMFQQSLVKLCADFLALMAGRPLVERGRALLDAPRETPTGAVDPGPLAGAIEMSNVTFSYAAAGAPLLSGLSLQVAPGEHVAIVGGSGSGKSTVLRLLLGFERPSAGSITFDGQELQQLDAVSVRAQIGVVLQSSMLFSGTILENIRGASEASLEQCLDAADAAGLGSDLERMGMGVHTPVTEGGGLFSGGQKQRILIARALAGNPRILFFDEATSALDNATQAVVARTLDALAVTRITIAHRLSTVRNADRIVVLAGGRFVESGTYEELMTIDGHFAALVRRQLAET